MMSFEDQLDVIVHPFINNFVNWRLKVSSAELGPAKRNVLILGMHATRTTPECDGAGEHPTNSNDTRWNPRCEIALWQFFRAHRAE